VEVAVTFLGDDGDVVAVVVVVVVQPQQHELQRELRRGEMEAYLLVVDFVTFFFQIKKSSLPIIIFFKCLVFQCKKIKYLWKPHCTLTFLKSLEVFVCFVL